MRALVEISADPARLISEIADEPTYTAIVLCQTAPTASDAVAFANKLRKQPRYPRLWIAQTSDNHGYTLGSDLHVALRQLGLSHKYRVSDNCLDSKQQWPQWLKFIDSRFHI